MQYHILSTFHFCKYLEKLTMHACPVLYLSFPVLIAMPVLKRQIFSIYAET